MNSDQEEFAFKLFLELHGNLPSGEKSESPDFIIHIDGKRIGIEITELMEETKLSISSAAKYSIEDKIAKSAQRQYDNISDKRLNVNLQIANNLNISKNRVDHLSRLISEILRDEIKDFPYAITHNLEINADLPEEILGIYYDVYPFLDESHFSVMRGKWTGSFNIIDLNRAIRKKECYTPLYKSKTDLVYLLILEGLSFSSYLGPFEMIGTIVDNSFDKIFLLKILSRQLFEIK